MREASVTVVKGLRFSSCLFALSFEVHMPLESSSPTLPPFFFFDSRPAV